MTDGVRGYGGGRHGYWWDTKDVKPPAASYRLTKEVFVAAEREWPDLMEPWSTRVAESIDLIEQQRIMREGLGATFRQRFPAPDSVWENPLK